MAHDSFVTRGVDFTPYWAFSSSADEAEIGRLFAALSEGGQVLMRLDNYGRSCRFGWVSDKFGVSRQINLQ